MIFLMGSSSNIITLAETGKDIILIDMPGSGKTTVGKILAKKLKREFIDIDDTIKDLCYDSCEEIINKYGEDIFRYFEHKCLVSIMMTGSNRVIATGGGIICRKDNIPLLRKGLIFFINRYPLFPQEDHPLSDTLDKLENLYQQRVSKYEKTADWTVFVDPGMTSEDVANEILDTLRSVMIKKEK